MQRTNSSANKLAQLAVPNHAASSALAHSQHKFDSQAGSPAQQPMMQQQQYSQSSHVMPLISSQLSQHSHNIDSAINENQASNGNGSNSGTAANNLPAGFPRLPQSAYSRFKEYLLQQRNFAESLMREPQHAGASFLSIIAWRWDAMSPADRARYEQQALLDVERFEAQVQQYEQQQQHLAVSQGRMPSSVPTVSALAIAAARQEQDAREQLQMQQLRSQHVQHAALQAQAQHQQNQNQNQQQQQSQNQPMGQQHLQAQFQQQLKLQQLQHAMQQQQSQGVNSGSTQESIHSLLNQNATNSTGQPLNGSDIPMPSLFDASQQQQQQQPDQQCQMQLLTDRCRQQQEQQVLEQLQRQLQQQQQEQLRLQAQQQLILNGVTNSAAQHSASGEASQATEGLSALAPPALPNAD